MLIDKKALHHLASLARIELDPEKEEKLLKDLESILGHFDGLKTVNTENIAPMAGGTDLISVFRDDGDSSRLDLERAREQFPEEESNFLKIPPVFE